MNRSPHSLLGRGLIMDAIDGGSALGEEKHARLREFEVRLLEKNKSINLTGARDLDTLRREHTLDSLTLLPLLEKHCRERKIERPRLIDVGSGGGFPAVPLAIACDTLEVVCLESVGKKARALAGLAAAAGLNRLTVLIDRAERLAHDPQWREAFDLGTARAIGHLATAAELVLPFLKAGGILLAQKGGEPAAEIGESREAIAELGGRIGEVCAATAAAGAARHTIIPVEKIAPTPPRYPRRVGLPAKRPLVKPRK